jgi:inorganic pyrophosphatase
MNLLHQLSPGSDFPNEIYVIVKVPKGSRNKYEYDRSPFGEPSEPPED